VLVACHGAIGAVLAAHAVVIHVGSKILHCVLYISAVKNAASSFFDVSIRFALQNSLQLVESSLLPLSFLIAFSNLSL
jgi:hypothetical protein